MANKTGKEDKKSAFNPAKQYVESLSRLWDAKDMAFISRDYDRVFRILKCIYNRIEHKLDKDEIEKVETILKRIYPEIRKSNQKRDLGELTKDMDELDKRLKRLADSYSLIMPSKADPRFAAYQ